MYKILKQYINKLLKNLKKPNNRTFYKKIDYLIVAPLYTPGQINYYQDRKKMLEELGLSVEIISIPYRASSIPLLSVCFLLLYAYKYKKYVMSSVYHYSPKTIEFQNITALFQNNSIFSKFNTIISFDYPLLLQNQYFFVTMLEKNIFMKAKLLITRSQYVFDQLKSNYTNLRFLPHAIKLSNNIETIVSDKNYVLSYCSPNKLFYFYKGLDILVKTWEIISANNSNTLIIAGPSEQDAKNYLKRLNITIPSTIRFVGFISKSKLFNYMKHAKYIIRSSRIEEFGRTTLESLALKRIVFSTPTNGSNEILTKIDKKLLSTSFEPSDLAKTIMQYKNTYSDIELKTQSVLSEYSYMNVKSKLSKIINQFID